LDAADSGRSVRRSSEARGDSYCDRWQRWSKRSIVVPGGGTTR
jgi:hypothetical protein